jgi:hypothetical protein
MGQPFGGKEPEKANRTVPATIFPEFPITVLSGTGKFEGAKGDGSQTGERLTPLSSGAEMYADVVINLKK